MKRRTRNDSATHATSFPRLSATIPRVRAFVWGSVPLLTKMYSGPRVVDVDDEGVVCWSEMDFGSSGFRLTSVYL
jgi:hypothetical protein